MTELLPCPFCGGKPELGMFGLVYCPDCGATICIENWNTRMQAQEIVLDAASLSNTFSLSDTLSIQGETYRRECTCQMLEAVNGYEIYCDKCDFTLMQNVEPIYCPGCGAKVVE